MISAADAVSDVLRIYYNVVPWGNSHVGNTYLLMMYLMMIHPIVTSPCVRALLDLLYSLVDINTVCNLLPCSSAIVVFSAFANLARKPVQTPTLGLLPVSRRSHHASLKFTIASSRSRDRGSPATLLPVEWFPRVRSLLRNIAVTLLLLLSGWLRLTPLIPILLLLSPRHFRYCLW